MSDISKGALLNAIKFVGNRSLRYTAEEIDSWMLENIQSYFKGK